MACSRTSSCTNLLIIINLLQKLYCIHGSQKDEMIEESRSRLEGSLPAQPPINEKPLLSSLSFQNPTAVNSKQETERSSTRRLHSQAPKGLLLVGKNGESKSGGGGKKDAVYTALHPSPEMDAARKPSSMLSGSLPAR